MSTTFSEIELKKPGEDIVVRLNPFGIVSVHRDEIVDVVKKVELVV